jgi:hemerythrin-like metal-binding protein
LLERPVEFFTWKDSFCIGIDTLDAQHRSLLECLNDCHRQVTSHKGAPLDPALLARLSAYAAHHFASEETMMYAFGYREVAAQRREHAAFRARVAELEEARAKGVFLSAEDVLTFLRDWVLQHVLGEDRKFAVVVLAAKPSEP